MKKILIVEDESMVALDLKLILTRAGYKVCGIADSVKEALALIEEQKPEMVLLDIFLKGPLSGIDLAKTLTAQNIAFVYLSANFQESILEKAKTTQPYGFMVKPFREKELLITLDVAFYRHQNSLESKLRQEKELEQLISKAADEPTEWEKKLLKIARGLQPHVPFDYLSITTETLGEFLYDGLNFFRTGFDEYQSIGIKEFLTMTNLSPDELKRLQQLIPVTTKAGFFNDVEFDNELKRYALKKVIANTFRLKSMLLFPLLMPNGSIINCAYYSRKSDGYSADHLSLLSRLQWPLMNAMDGIILKQDFDRPLSKIKPYPESKPAFNAEVKGFENMIVKSHQMLAVQDMVSVVAPLDTSVLILGESGTGKERIAKSIHQLSARNKNQLVTVNCASLPANLIESELFGHEKGAFTGAIEKRIGKFEQADKGTIFLDEIGEMPAELQVKLLRVLQEQEIERIGGKAPIKINVRIIAATNRVLEKEVEEGRFRLDLYYRLYVFPIIIPPLRERKDDIVALANHFIKHFSSKNGKTITGLSDYALDQLTAYHWPGNVRELEHLMERTILLSAGPMIKEISLPRLYNNNTQPATNYYEAARPKSIDDNAREHILSVLKKCNGKISGAGGAAEILEVQPTTLHSKIKKLGIKKHEF